MNQIDILQFLRISLLNEEEVELLPRILSLESGIWGDQDRILSLDNERRVLQYLYKFLKKRASQEFPTTIEVFFFFFFKQFFAYFVSNY